jgi:hypothetical protein
MNIGTLPILLPCQILNKILADLNPSPLSRQKDYPLNYIAITLPGF